MNKKLKFLILILLGVIGINSIGQYVYKRFDLTSDKRYTLSNNSKELIKDADRPLIIDVFLTGEIPSEFRVLQNETRQLIEEFQISNSNIKVNYIDPLEDEATRERNIQELTKSGLEPYVNSRKTSGKVTQELLFPWAFASYQDQTVAISLMKRSITEDLPTQISNSVQHLEYAFADGFKKILKPKSKKIAVLKGNGQLEDIYIADFLKTLQDYYNIAPFTLDSVSSNPQKTLDNLKNFDLVISAKPTEAFSEMEKLVLDQYLVSGGKSIWLTESIVMDKDSLYNDSGSSTSIIRDLNLNDFFFKYGVRINPSLVKDLYSAPITLAIGEGSQSQFQPVQWQYSPLASSNKTHPITKNLELVKFDFASPIDTLKNNIKKTILLQSSTQTKLEGPLQTIALETVTQPPIQEEYKEGQQNLAVLLEGSFKSCYSNRVLPFAVDNYLEQATKPTQFVVVSDGDIIKNEVSRSGPLELGFDRFTGRSFGNKEFLLNTVNYMMDDDGLINIRNKDISVAYLDSDKIESQKNQWQLVNILVPLLILGLFGFLFQFLRRKKYASKSA